MTTCIPLPPTGREWVATTTEGLMVYALDSTLVFTPYDFGVEVTPDAVLTLLAERKHIPALKMALRLNEHEYIVRALQSIPIEQGNAE